MVDFLIPVSQQIRHSRKGASIFLPFGFALAGVLAVLAPARTLIRFFGGSKVEPMPWAAAIGAPLPPCSCGVLPAALGLRRGGTGIGRPLAVR